MFGEKNKFLFSLFEFLFSLFEIFSHFHMWVFVFLSHLSVLFFWGCILFTCCYLLRFRLFLSAPLGFFGTRLFQLFVNSPSIFTGFEPKSQRIDDSRSEVFTTRPSKPVMDTSQMALINQDITMSIEAYRRLPKC